MAKKRAAEEHAERLYDVLSGEDLTSHQIMEKLGWSYNQFQSAAQRLRDMLAADGEVISVLAEPPGARGPWLYGLRDGRSAIDVEQSRWVPNRIQDAERRIKTITHVLDAAVNATDGRSIDGKKARIYRLHIKRAQEEVAMIHGEQDES